MFKGVLLSGQKVESLIRRIVALDTKLPYVKGDKIMSYMKAGKMMARESEGWAYVIQAQDNSIIHRGDSAEKLTEKKSAPRNPWNFDEKTC